MAYIRWKRETPIKKKGFNPYVKNYKGNTDITSTKTEAASMRTRKMTSMARIVALSKNNRRRRRRWGVPLVAPVSAAKIAKYSIKKGRTPRQRIRAIASGSTFSSYTKVYKGSRPVAKAYKQLSPKQYLHETSSIRVSTISSTEASGCGLQKATGFPMLRPTQLSTIMVAAGGTAYTTQILMRKTDYMFTMTNQENVNTFIDLYEVSMRPNRSCVDGPVSAWSNGLVHESGGTVTTDTYGVTPYSSRAFTTMYKINKVTHLELGAGRSHRHKVTLIYNRLINKEELTELPTTAYGIYPFTNMLMMVAYGAPINDATSKANVSTGPVAIDVVYSTKYEYQYVEPNTTSYSFTNSLPSITTPNVQDYGNSSAENTSAA